MAKLSVAVVAENIVRRDGQGRVALEIARSLASRGHEVKTVASKLAPELHGLVHLEAVPVGSGPQMMKDLRFARAAKDALGRIGSDVVLTMGSSVIADRGPVVYYAAYTHDGWHRIWSQAGYRPSPYHRLHASWARRVERRALTTASRVIVMADRMIGEVAAIGASESRVSVVPGAVDVTEYPVATPAERDEARAKLGVTGFGIALIGEYSTGRKGLPVLAEALSSAKGEETLIIHGRGPRESTHTRLQSQGIRALFPDPALPVQQVLAACDAVAIPSLYEPFSLVALESAAAGVPVIISSVAGAADHLGPDHAAMVVPPNDPPALRAAIDSLKVSPERRMSMTKRARELVERLDWSTITGRIADLIEETSIERR